MKTRKELGGKIEVRGLKWRPAARHARRTSVPMITSPTVSSELHRAITSFQFEGEERN